LRIPLICISEPERVLRERHGNGVNVRGDLRCYSQLRCLFDQSGSPKKRVDIFQSSFRLIEEDVVAGVFDFDELSIG
jgi:hypothetical protein